MKKFIASMMLGAVLIAGGTGCGAMQPDETATCTVVDKTASKDYQSGSTDYRIYTEECGTFQVADSITRGTWRSSDTYGRIKVDHTYEFTYHGFRNGFLSMFPNITEAKEVK